MRPTFRYAAAASVAAVALAAFLLAGNAAPALADVVKAAEEHRLVRYKIVQTTEDKAGGATATSILTAYADLRAPRFRTEGGGPALNGAVMSRSVSVSDGRKGRGLHTITETVVPEKLKDVPQAIKDAVERMGLPRKEATLTRADSPGGAILENLKALEQHAGVVASRDRRDGKALLKYRLEEGKTTTTLWVDAATKLPVRLEQEILDHTPTISRNHWVFSDFEWDPALKGVASADELFDLTPPKGYTVTDRTEDKPAK
jgi:hypothetical protein